MAKCDCVCISREELEELRARAAGCSEIPPKKKKSAPKKTTAKKTTAKKTTARKSTPKKSVPKAVPVAPMISEPVRATPVKQIAAPKKTTAKKTTAKKKAIKEPKSPTYKPKKKKTAPKKKAQTADYRIVQEEPVTKAVSVSTPYRGKVLEKRERKQLNAPALPTLRLPTKGLPKREFPKEKLKQAHEGRKKARAERLSRREDEDTSVAVRTFQRPTDNLKRYDAPKELPQTTSTAIVPRRETAPKALPAPDDGKTITATEYKITEAEDCSQGSFFQRQACKRRNRKNGFRA